MPPPEDGFVAQQRRRHERQASLNIAVVTIPQDPVVSPKRRRSSGTVFPVSRFR